MLALNDASKLVAPGTNLKTYQFQELKEDDAFAVSHFIILNILAKVLQKA